MKLIPNYFQSYRSVTKCNLLPVYPMVLVMAPHRSFVGYSLILKHLALLLLLSLLVVFFSTRYAEEMLTILIESVSLEVYDNFSCLCLPNLKNNWLYWVLCNLAYKSKVIYASEKSMNLHDFFPLVIASFHNSSVGFTHKWEAWPLQQRNKFFFSSYEIKLALWNKLPNRYS